MKDDVLVIKKILERCDKIEECIEFFGRDEDIFLSNEIFQKSCAFDILQIDENQMIKNI